MKRVVLYLLLFTICFLNSTEQIQIGDGNITNSHLPVYNRINYSYSQMIYPDYLFAYDIEIIGIAFNLNFDPDTPNPDAYNQFFQLQNDIVIKLGMTDTNSFNNSSWFIDNDLAECFNGTWSSDDFEFTDASSGWLNISLETPFQFHQGQSLLISIDENRDGYLSAYERFLCHSYADTMGLYTGSMNTNIDPNQLDNETIYYETNLPNIRLIVNREMIYPEQPYPINGAVDIAVNTNLNWYWNAESYDIFLGTNENNLSLIGENQASESFDIPFDLQLDTNYYWRVEGQFPEELRVGPVWHFVTLEGQNVCFQDDFESYPAFQDLSQPWTAIDGDEADTYGLTGWDFTGEGEPHCFLVWEPGQLTDFPFNAFTGEKCIVSLASVIPPNSDLIISPVIDPIETGSFSFVARSMTAQYGLERLKLYIYPNADLSNPISLLEESYLEVPDVWTHFDFNISEWSNQSIRVGIECCSYDALLLAVDNLMISGVTANQNNVVEAVIPCLSIYPNPISNQSKIEFYINVPSKATLSIYDIKGRRLGEYKPTYDQLLANSIDIECLIETEALSSGIYFIKLESGNHSQTSKAILIK